MAQYKPTGFGRQPSHHPDHSLLLDYASGATSEAESLIVATHLTLCAECRRELARLEAVGGSLLESIEPATLDNGFDSGFAAVMARIDGEDAAAPTVGDRRDGGASPGTSCCACDGDDHLLLPAPVRALLDRSLDRVEWKPIMRGLDEAPLPDVAGGAKVRLMRIRAGATVPKHTHRGTEMTLVLAGGFSDEGGHFERGDLAVLGAEADHRPVADPGEDCLCLVVTTAPLRLTGRMGRLLNPFVRF